MKRNESTATHGVRCQPAGDLSSGRPWVTPSFERARMNEALEGGGPGEDGVETDLIS